MKFKLDDLLVEPDPHSVPDNYVVTCQECGWKGYIKDCKTEEEQDGWETPVYTVLLCPKCEGVVEI